jgi:hypothetical protein
VDQWSGNGVVVIPAILDFEASGLGRGSYPIEVGYILADGSSDCMLIRPEPDWQSWDPEAERLHGIDREQLVQHGRPVREVASQLNRELRGETLYTDAWGSDLSWLSLLFDAADLVPLFRLESLRTLLDEPRQRHWHSVHRAVISELALGRHRASADARALQQTYLRTCLLADPAPAATGLPLSA